MRATVNCSISTRSRFDLKCGVKLRHLYVMYPEFDGNSGTRYNVKLKKISYLAKSFWPISLKYFSYLFNSLFKYISTTRVMLPSSPSPVTARPLSNRCYEKALRFQSNRASLFHSWLFYCACPFLKTMENSL